MFKFIRDLIVNQSNSTIEASETDWNPHKVEASETDWNIHTIAGTVINGNKPGTIAGTVINGNKPGTAQSQPSPSASYGIGVVSKDSV